jgi:hypothetical protein
MICRIPAHIDQHVHSHHIHNISSIGCGRFKYVNDFGGACKTTGCFVFSRVENGLWSCCEKQHLYAAVVVVTESSHHHVANCVVPY